MTEARPPSPPSQVARWIIGPVVALLMGALTLWLTGIFMPLPQKPVKVYGTLRLSSDPEGASVFVEGKVHPETTPTALKGEVGSTLHISFRLAGYMDREADVLVGEGERPFRAKLERHEVAVPQPEQLEPPLPPPMHEVHREVQRPRKEPKRPVVELLPPSAGPTGTLSVHVRPWAIVFVDGQKIRQTPINGEILSAGLHKIELVNDEIKKSEKVTIEVRANGAEEVRRNWER